mgnify:CR=1 FL=1
MDDTTRRRDLTQIKLALSVLKNKISLAEHFLTQAQAEVYRLQEVIFDEEDAVMDKIQIYVNQL